MYNIRPITQTDWDGTGVVPDMATPAAKALRSAHISLFDQLTENAAHERIVEHYDRVKTKLNKPEVTN